MMVVRHTRMPNPSPIQIVRTGATAIIGRLSTKAATAMALFSARWNLWMKSATALDIRMANKRPVIAVSKVGSR